MPNPPEAALAAREGGTRSAPESSAHRQWTPLARALAAAGDSWTLAIAAELAPGRMRLSTLRGRLAGVSAGLLDRYLQRMARAGLITRSRYREMPPRVEIELTDAGRELLPVASALARWGLRRAWSPPRSEERVDVEALICQLPLLLDLRPTRPSCWCSPSPWASGAGAWMSVAGSVCPSRTRTRTTPPRRSPATPRLGPLRSVRRRISKRCG
jgi:DNA-binding HxlR family transcriptional regulator